MFAKSQSPSGSYSLTRKVSGADPHITSSCDVLGTAGWVLWVHTRPSPPSQQGELSQGRATAG